MVGGSSIKLYGCDTKCPDVSVSFRQQVFLGLLGFVLTVAEQRDMDTAAGKRKSTVHFQETLL